jgi:PIN domain nuclease of toxin-antitoxin system
MASRWLLDTSALLALRDNEAGAEHVAAIKACAMPSRWPMP